MAAPSLDPKDGVLIKTVEMHTGGEPLRIVVSGTYVTLKNLSTYPEYYHITLI